MGGGAGDLIPREGMCLMRVISLTTTYPDSYASAKPRFVHLLNKGLANLGIDVLTICPHSGNAAKSETIEGVEVKRFKYIPKRFALGNSISEKSQIKSAYFEIAIMVTVFFFTTLVSCMKNRPDIIHGQWAFPSGYIACLLARMFSAKPVITAHYGEIPPLQKFPFLRKRVVSMLNKSHKVIANSNYTKGKLMEIGIKEKKITIVRPIPNFVSHEPDREFLKEFKSRFAPPDHKIILFCGRLVEHKGVQYLIRSIPAVKTKNIRLVVAGDGIVKNKLKELAESLDLGDRITFYGKPTYRELGLLHDISDVFVCPSIIDSRGLTDGLGLVVPEAMESGLPVVASSVGGIVDVIQHKNNGVLVPEKSPDSIANAIDEIFTDSKLRSTMIHNARDTVRKMFLPKAIVEQHMQIFRSV